ncbi:MAG: hypothetical protein DRN03_01845 [Thermoplasmata archaeon]|nr:MAG: hypothetical protein DRN03_01845 [Thermoplasmata archaeon]
MISLFPILILPNPMMQAEGLKVSKGGKLNYRLSSKLKRITVKSQVERLAREILLPAYCSS